MEEKKGIYLSVIIPTYNEEKLIGSTLIDINKYFCNKKYNYEIIVADDGSNDGTVNIVENARKSVNNLTIAQNDKNHGKGYAVRRAMLFANGKFRLFMDADNSTDIEQIENFIPYLEKGYDVAIGDRQLSESKIIKHQSIYKEFLGRFGNKAVKLLLVSEINDTQCGFKCFTSDFVNDIFPRLTIDRWGFDIEILALANKFGYKIKSVSVVWKNREESKLKILDYILTLKELIQIKINLITKKYE